MWPTDLTPQDIAAALAFVPAGLGREEFAWLCWPDGARLRPFQLDQLMSNMAHTEAAWRLHRLVESTSSADGRVWMHRDYRQFMRHSLALSYI